MSFRQFKVSVFFLRFTLQLTSEKGFFRSIGLRNENALQDTLRLLTLWFKFGAHDEVSQAMASGFSVVEVDTWLEVIPQVRSSQYWSHSSLKYSLDHCAYPNPKC